MATMRVLLSLSPPDGSTRYVDQVVTDAPASVHFLFFRWRTALFGRYDVVHVHWPELMIRARHPAKAWMRRRALTALLVRTRVMRIPILRTVHNDRPHEEGSAAETRALARLDRSTSLAIVLTATTRVPHDIPTVHIPHGDYRTRFAPSPDVAAIAGRVLFFGLIRPYKNVDGLISSFVELGDDRFELRIVGRPSPALRRPIEERIASVERVSGRLEFLPDAELVDEVTASSLVALPYLEMSNSGAVLVALSLDRPVLVPDSPATAELAEEVGSQWMYRYSGEFTASVLRDAIEWSRAARTERPVLDGRDWATIGRQHARVYENSIAAARSRRFPAS